MRLESNTREIPLTKGFVALVDEADYEMVSHFKWMASTTPAGETYVKRSVKRGGDWQHEYLHRMIMLPDPGQHVDHINGDPLDNRRRNLRVCTHSDNLCNSGKKSHNTSGYLGVQYIGSRKRWHGVVAKDGIRYCTGHYRSPESAAIARDSLALEVQGAFAHLNFPERGR